ncbi:hypothetical protein DQG23_03425 [Paenibacillus contaminans]|uniref:Uncharacterized protein n=1 Tax=Paenibacillus contaminans TaxID=450362 RepID=A0A329MTG9_9BACL|nr:hypothetical protein DQG23_03425 [Paenibacillus contaminans]
MIGFLLFFAAALGVSLTFLIRSKAERKEIFLFVGILFLGFADWMSIFLDHKFKSSKIIANLMEWIGL